MVLEAWIDNLSKKHASGRMMSSQSSTSLPVDGV